MNKLSETSKMRLATCHPSIQEVVNEAIKVVDFSVLCGYRDEAEQNEAFESGASNVQYPNSKHNSLPSLAVDLAPYPIDWKNKERFAYLAGVVMAIAKIKGIELRWGGTFKKPVDMPHFELVSEHMNGG